MKKILVIGFVFASVSLQADTVGIASDLVNEFNSLTAANVFITPNPAWATAPAGAGWISYANTGDDANAFSPPNNSLAPLAIFTENFFLPFAINTGSVRVWADDTASVAVDGSPVGPAANLVLGNACANAPISCVQDAFADINLDGLSQGAHSLTFSVYQLGGGPFGLLYSGSVTSTDPDPAPTPEPDTFVLLGSSLLGLSIVLRRLGAKRVC